MKRPIVPCVSAVALLAAACSQPVSQGWQDVARPAPSALEDRLGIASVGLAGASLAGIDLASPNLGGTRFGNGRDAVALAGHTLGGRLLDGAELALSRAGATDLGGSNIAGGHLMGNDVASRNLGEAAGAGLAPADGLLYSGEDRAMPSDGRCVVVGLGSTAFAKLLAQNAGPTLRAAIGKLPWGFAATRGGAMALEAWEVEVWGSSTYCVFVVASPRNASWNAVERFVASVFRWNAPPTKTIEIGAMGGSQGARSVVSHEGSMDAGAKVRSGAVTEKDFVAAELAFVTAASDASSPADLSSWVRNAGNTGAVLLSNVGSLGAPTHAESVYAVLDRRDGTVDVVLGRATGGAAAAELGPIVDSYEELDRSYVSYRSGRGTKPLPKRCGGSLYLMHRFGEPMRDGACDEGLAWEIERADRAPGRTRWSDYTNFSASPPYQTVAPYDDFMSIRAAGAADFERRSPGFGTAAVIAETYVQLWERAYDESGR
jgi:hypothetical protein